jgi:heme/copper-type cytochrome/quinol oxidase subunit 3
MSSALRVDVPREEALRARPPRRARASGWWGMAVFVAAEATLFGTIFGSYYYLRFQVPRWPPAGIEPPALTVPLVLAVVLALTSIPMAAASGAAGRGLARRTWLLILAASIVQTGYFAMQMRLFQDDLAKFTPQSSAYGSIYFTMLGAHAAHVAVGLLLNVWLLARLARGLTRYRVVAVQATSFYWHFVNVLALLVVAVQLSSRVG